MGRGHGRCRDAGLVGDTGPHLPHPHKRLAAGRRDGRTAWARPCTDFPLLRVDPAGAVRARRNQVRGARGLAVLGGRVVLFAGYGGDHDRIAECRLTGQTVEVAEQRLTRPDGSPPGRRSRVFSRGPWLYVQAEPRTEWWVLELA